MLENEIRRQIVDTGLFLLDTGLVARTWGNVSAKADAGHYLITPSGLDYLMTNPEDLALVELSSGEYQGKFKPSSEKGVHAAAYEALQDANFVIHTHQIYASALGVYGFEDMDITEQEKALLGGVALADYGLPGTEELKNAVKSCYECGAHTVIMKSHGVVAVGSSKKEAIDRVNLLEEICKRNCKGLVDGENPCITWSKVGEPIYAQLDDMAQMIGRAIPVVEAQEAVFDTANAVIVKDKGIFVKGIDEDDAKALEILATKAAVVALHVRANGVNFMLPDEDCESMRRFYVDKYSKQKDAKK